MRNHLVEEEKFSEFYKWMRQLEDYLKLLLKIAQENNSEKAVHHKEFYNVKWANEDVLAFFALLWLTPPENVYLWVTGWKPSIIFQLVKSLKDVSLVEMTEEQVRKIETLRVNIKAHEVKVERGMERQHLRIGDRNIVQLVQLERIAKRNGDSAAVNWVNNLVEAALRELLAGLKMVMKIADCVLDVLNPTQCINFLIVMSKLHNQMRRWAKSEIINEV